MSVERDELVYLNLFSLFPSLHAATAIVAYVELYLMTI